MVTSFFVKEVSNRRIFKEEKENLLSENFDPSFFSGYDPIVSIVKNVTIELGCIAPESQVDYLVAVGIRSVEVLASNSTQGAVYAVVRV